MAVSCKGKNGWFDYAENLVSGNSKVVHLQLFSKRRPPVNMAPVVIEGPKAEVEALLLDLLEKVRAL